MNEMKRGRRPAQGGYARGDETRLRIIHAAIELFGERGFDYCGNEWRDLAIWRSARGSMAWTSLRGSARAGIRQYQRRVRTPCAASPSAR